MSEHYLSGYCRQLDAARLVEVVVENGAADECDCCYGDCKFQSQCTIAAAIEELTENA